MLLFPIETANRELIPKLYLASKFAELGRNSYVGQKSQIWNTIKYIKNPIYFDKGYHKGFSEGIYESIKKNKGFIISLDEENGVDLKSNNTLNHRFTELALSYFDLIFLWGNPQFKHLEASRSNFIAKKAFSSGHPRFDLLKTKFRKLYSRVADDLKLKYGNFILFNMSFGFGNNVLGDDFVVKNYGDRISNIRDFINYDKSQINHFLELIDILSKNTSLNIIIRPHPEEDTDFYKVKFAGKEKIHVLHEGPVIPWIMASKFMIHHSCTTAVEACMLDKKPLSYGKNYNRDLIPWIPLELSEVFDNSDNLIKYINGEESYLNDKHKDILSEYFSFNNNATNKIIKEVNKNFPMQKPSFFRYSKANFWFKSNLKLFLKSILKQFRIYKSSPLFENKFSSFSSTFINEIITIMKKEKLISEKIKIVFINRELLQISNDN